jgi:receptor expression-enhancing protein 5/6
VPRVYIFVAGALLAFAFLFLGLGASFVTTVVAVAYPTYASLRAIESAGKTDDMQWCAAWCRRAVVAATTVSLLLWELLVP